MRRQSSQSSQTSKVQSPGSAGEHHPLRHPVKPARRTKIVLPRNHSSARDLAKLGRQPQGNHAVTDGRKNSRQKSHEGDTEIRLPGSLDNNKAPPMGRNMTAYQLPRNTSHTKLKKNLSHGQLTRIESGKNLSGLNSTSSKGPPSPGLKNRSKRSKSAELAVAEKDLHEGEVELAQKQQEKKEGPKKVGFAVGSSGDSDGEVAPEMEGSGMQEDEWTDQSASASPYSTRQNTANNSRRASVVVDKPPEKRLQDANMREVERLRHAQQQAELESRQEEDGTPAGSQQSDEDEDQEEDEEDDEEDEETSPHTMPQVKKRSEVPPEPPTLQLSATKAPRQSSPQGAREPSNPATRHLLTRNTQSPAPALVSNVSALDDGRSARGSPAPSMRSSRSNIGDGTAEQDPEELVSRFIPSTSHPSTGSGGNTAMNTPKIGSFHTPEDESTLDAQHRGKAKAAFSPAPVSPGSTISGSSGAATPAMGRSRTELRMMNEKAMAEMEDAAARNPIIPPHVYDRRNESLKSYLNIAALGGDGRGGLSSKTGLSLGPELFQGRFKAVNTELKVVQKFRDPIGESVHRLEKCKGTKFAQLRGQRASPQKPAAKVPISRSAASLAKQPSKPSTSTSPPKSASPIKPGTSSVKSTTAVRDTESRRSRVTFAETPPEVREVVRSEENSGPDAVAKQLWESYDG